MAVETGLTWLFYVDTAEDIASPTWAKLPQQRGGNLNFSKSDVDATNKDESGWETSISTRRGWSASVDGCYEDNDSALDYLIDANQLHATVVNKPVNIKLVDAAGDTYIATATLDSIELDCPEADLVSYSLSFTGRGSLTLTRA